MENNDKKIEEIIELINLIIILKKSNHPHHGCAPRPWDLLQG